MQLKQLRGHWLQNKILVIGDAHVYDGDNLNRFLLLGKFIIDHQPTHIIIMGDFVTLDCLSHWNHDKRKKLEGKRYWAEIKKAQRALQLMFLPMQCYNIAQASYKKKQYKPELVFIKGNHENRLDRYFDTDPVFEGAINLERDLGLQHFKFKIVEYKEYYYLNGIAFTHIPFNKIKEISGVNVCRTAQSVVIGSTVFSHTHEQNISNIHRKGQPHLQQVYNCGCFFEDTPEYAGGHLTNYWKGVTLLLNYKEGRFDYETWSTGRLERVYGDGK